MQINPLSEVLKGIDFKPVEHKLSLPIPTPKPERNKVTAPASPFLKPIDRQAARLLFANRDHLAAPLPMPPERLPNPFRKENEEIKAQLQIERNEHAITRDKLGLAKSHLRAAKFLISQLQSKIQSLRKECESKDEIIRQLEDLRL